MNELVCAKLHRDVSHPDTVHQNIQVLQTFARMKVPFKDKNNLLTVANKIDKIPVRLQYAFVVTL
jgi:50S ribosomal subunit-associated GTPase HflX